MQKFILALIVCLSSFATAMAQDSNGTPTAEGMTVGQPLGSTLDNATISLFPNPVVNQLSIDLGMTFDHPVRVAVFNFIGQELISRTVESETSRIKIDCSDLETGVYFVKVTDGPNEVVRKFIK